MGSSSSRLNWKAFAISVLVGVGVLIGIGIFLPSSQVVSSYASTAAGSRIGDVDNNGTVDLNDLTKFYDLIKAEKDAAKCSACNHDGVITTQESAILKTVGFPHSETYGNINDVRYKLAGTTTTFSGLGGDDAAALSEVIVSSTLGNSTKVNKIYDPAKLGTEFNLVTSKVSAVLGPTTSTTSTTSTGTSTTVPPATSSYYGN